MSYIDGESTFRYPAAGDPLPDPPSADVLILTIGNITQRGKFDPRFCKAWAPFPKRDKAKEAQINGATPKA